MSDTGYIGEHIAHVIDGIRAEADEKLKFAEAIESAWSDWDIDELSRLNVLTPDMAADWAEEKAYVQAGEARGWSLVGEPADDLIEALNADVDAPFVRAYKSTLGGAHNVAVLLTVSADPREEWGNGILENSRFAKLVIGTDGVIEFITGSGPRFRKYRSKSLADAVARINKYVGTLE